MADLETYKRNAMAHYSYMDGGGNISANEAMLPNISVVMVTPPWMAEANGYYGVIYRDDITGQYYMANRGSDTLTDFLPTNLQFSGLFSSDGLPDQYHDARAFLDLASQTLGIPESAFIQVGHSLGGGLAKLLAVATGSVATVFNAPSISSIIDELEAFEGVVAGEFSSQNLVSRLFQTDSIFDSVHSLPFGTDSVVTQTLIDVGEGLFNSLLRISHTISTTIPILDPFDLVGFFNGFSVGENGSHGNTPIFLSMSKELFGEQILDWNLLPEGESMVALIGGFYYELKNTNGTPEYTKRPYTEISDPDADNMFSVELYHTDKNGKTSLYSYGDKGGELSIDDALVRNPSFKPTSVSLQGADGVRQDFVGVEGSSFISAFSQHMGDATSLVLSGVNEIVHEASGMVYAAAHASIDVPNGFGGNYQVSLGSVVDMIEQEMIGLEKFTINLIQKTAQETFNNIQNQSPILIAQIIAGLLQGKDFEDVVAPIALQLVQSGASTALFAELKKAYDPSGTSTSLGFLDDLQRDHNMAYDATKGALIAIAMTAITNGKNAGLADYARAAATPAFQVVVNQGIVGNGYAAFTQEVVPGGVDFIGPRQVVISPAGAGAIAALTVIASSLISGDGITTDTLRDAAVAGATAATATAIADAIVVGAKLGTVGGAVGIAIGIVVGAVLGLVIGNAFSTPGERIYHNETIGSFVNDDTIIGIREEGALLRTNINIPNAVGSDSGADVLVGGDEQNILLGMGNDDMLEGRGGNDYLQGGAGNDHIEGGAGNDYIEGNGDNDKILAGYGDDYVLGGDGDDVISGGAGNDQIEGNVGDDLIYGDSGDDIIIGGDGADTIIGGAGDDIIAGGVGDDVISGSIGNDEIHGGDGADILMGDSGNDSIHGDSANDTIYGDEGIDVLYGDSGDDLIDGGADDDLIFGGLGDDVLFGDEGDDFIYGEIGNDYVVGGKGDDVLDGGDGDDIYTMNRGDGKDTISDSGGQKDILRLANYTLEEITFIKDGNNLILKTAPNGDDQVTIANQIIDKSIEYLMLCDGKTVDLSTLIFDDAGNISYNLVSDATQLNTLVTQATYPGTWQEIEEDRSYQTYNASSLWYNDNFDTSVMTSVERELYNDVQVRSNTVKTKHWYGRTTVVIHYYDYFENHLIGTQGPDRIVGASWDETIDGLGGNDQLYGNGGLDNVNGGADNDLIFGGSQNDNLFGGDGNDRAYGGMGDDVINGGDGNDAVYGEWGNDNLRGGAGDDLVSGGAGNDTIYGNGGADILYGDAGSDTIYGGDGDDFIIGGDGNDNLYGDAGNDYIEGGNGVDFLDGGDGDDILRGEGEGDNLIGGNGNDLLIGGKGGDTISGGEGIDTVSYAESDAGVNVVVNGLASGGYAQGDTLSGIENIIGSDYDDVLIGDDSSTIFTTSFDGGGSYADIFMGFGGITFPGVISSYGNILIGGYGNDRLYGGGGNDTLEGGAGADYLDGGAGYDSASYSDSNSGVEINLVTGRGKYGYAEGDIFVNMEHIIGSKYDDKFIIGSISSPSGISFEGGGGNDTVVIGGNVADYNIILDGTKYIMVRKSDNATYTLPDIEKLQFDDRTLSYDDFPSGNNSVASVARNTTVEGIIDRDVLKTMVVNHATQYGSLSFNNDGTYVYTSNGYTGNDELTYTLTNSDNLTRLIHIGFNVVDPVAPSLNFQTLMPEMGSANFNGTTGADTINGTNSWDTIKGNAGNDIIYGEAGNDQIEAGSGDDTVFGGDGDDIINGGYTSSIFFMGDETKLNFYPDNYYTAYSNGKPSISSLKNGGYVMSWYASDQGRICTQIFDEYGNKFGSEIFVGSANRGVNLSVVGLNNGNFVVTWIGSNSYGMYAQLYNASGAKIGNSFVVDDTYSYTTPSVISLSNGGFAIGWSGHYIQAYNNDGTKSGSKITITNSNNTQITDNGNESLAVLKNGDFIILKRTLVDYELYYQHYSSSGVPLSGVVLIGKKLFGSVVSLENGGFVIVSQGAGSNTIRADIFNSNGSLVRTAYPTGSYDSSGIKPHATSLQDGSFLMTWEGLDNAYDSTYGIYAQRFSEAGIAIGSSFRVNTTIQGNQSHPDVISLTNGGYVFTWNSQTPGVWTDPGSGYSVYQRVFAPTNFGPDGNDTLFGGNGNDTIYGGAGNNYLFGDAGSDTIYGGIYSDTIYGGSGDGAITDGDDTIYASEGNNTIFGEYGNDRIYAGAGADVIFGGDGDDLIDSGDGGDYIEGGAGNDTIYGGEGNNNISGNDGDDKIYAGSGTDTISGGAGNDIIFAGENNNNDTVTGDDGDDVIYGGGGSDTLSGNNGDDIIHGDGGNDYLYGNDGNDTIFGGAGDDQIFGGNGDDIIVGGDGDDNVSGEAENDIIYAGAGNDVINGGDGDDAVIFSGNFADYQIDFTSNGLTVTDKNITDGNDGTDNLVNIENLEFADINLKLFTADYANSKSAVNVDLSQTSLFSGIKYSTGHGGTAEGEKLTNIENLIGSSFNDNLIGDDNSNNIAGNDGDDVIKGAIGNDIINGGEGFDTASFAGASSGYKIVLDGQTIAVTDIDTSNGDEGTDILTNIEQLNFSNRNFTIDDDFGRLENGVANVLKNTITRGILGDVSDISFSIKINTVHGSLTFNDDGTYNYTPIVDYIGTDSFSYIATNALGLSRVINVDINVSTIPVITDLSRTSGNHIVVGSSVDNILYGSLGSDVITVGGGNDVVVINLSPNTKDIITDFDIADDKVDLSDYNFLIHNFGDLKSRISQKGLDAVINFGNGQILVLKDVDANSLSRENFLGDAKNAVPNLNLTGTSSNDTLTGAEGDDILSGGSGSDLLNGGSGNDTLIYSADKNWSTSFVAWNVGSPDAIDYTGEQIIIAPRIGNADAFDGGEGIDTIQMSDANEALFLDDRYTSNPFGYNTARIKNIEVINAGAGDDIIDLTSDQFTYNNITLNGEDGNDVLWSSSGNDIISGGNGNDNIDGGAGNDTLNGGEGNDAIYGKNGDDQITGNQGLDILTGGNGNDTFNFQNFQDSTINQTDIITDFTPGQDKINLSGLNYNHITFDDNPNDTITPEGLSYHFDSANNTIIQDQEHDFAIKLSGNINLSDGDFSF